ncbi:hypothetical protein X798_00245 [Onchocerca flexuosa]|uniref:Uncharacterized protein n=1 Tax=Onchocerca flexuosa TaxID=387005 RepID=A0A238C5K2_9BILA|nr:hypothetical protein X798_00245 [Onchocerca flexuosa]
MLTSSRPNKGNKKRITSKEREKSSARGAWCVVSLDAGGGIMLTVCCGFEEDNGDNKPKTINDDWPYAEYPKTVWLRTPIKRPPLETQLFSRGGARLHMSTKEFKNRRRIAYGKEPIDSSLGIDQFQSRSRSDPPFIHPSFLHPQRQDVLLRYYSCAENKSYSM